MKKKNNSNKHNKKNNNSSSRQNKNNQSFCGVRYVRVWPSTARWRCWGHCLTSSVANDHPVHQGLSLWNQDLFLIITPGAPQTGVAHVCVLVCLHADLCPCLWHSRWSSRKEETVLSRVHVGESCVTHSFWVKTRRTVLLRSMQWPDVFIRTCVQTYLTLERRQTNQSKCFENAVQIHFPRLHLQPFKGRHMAVHATSRVTDQV